MSDDRWRVVSEYYEPAAGRQPAKKPNGPIGGPPIDATPPPMTVVPEPRIDRADDGDFDQEFDAVLMWILAAVRFAIAIVSVALGTIWFVTLVISAFTGTSSSGF